MAHSLHDWRGRLAGRIGFDRAAAEASIRRVYRASNLREPDQILWARGPREAAETVRFLRRPPRRQRHFGVAMLVAGTVLWPALALAIENAGLPHDPVNAATLMGGIIAYHFAHAGAQSLPLQPTPSSSAANGIIVFAAMIGILLAVNRLGLPADPFARSVALGLTLLSGALPGALLLFRLHRAFRHLPDSLRNLSAVRSVARALLRSRNRGRPFPAISRAAASPHESLLHAYRSAYAAAFAHPGELVLDRRGAGPTPWIHLDGGASLMPSFLRRIDPALFRPMPAHLDGLQDAAAFLADGGITCGSAAFEDLAYHVDRLFPFRDVALAVLPATTMAVDADGRPHAEHGPALAWADGTRVYAWRGRVTDEDLLDPQLPLTRSRIMNETDRDRRRVLIERYGLGRFLIESRAPKIQSDECGTLYRLEQPTEPIVAVRVVNGTAEPDGSFRDFWLRVPPTMRTARQAVAWTFGLSAEQYDPVAQS